MFVVTAQLFEKSIYMKKLLLLATSAILATKALADRQYDNDLKSRLMDADSYVNAMIQKSKTLALENQGVAIEFADQIDGDSNPFFSTLAIGVNYQVLMQFSARSAYNTSNDSVDNRFKNARIILVPVFGTDVNESAATVASSWKCMTDIVSFDDNLVNLKKYMGISSPISRVTTNDYLAGCQTYKVADLDTVWEAAGGTSGGDNNSGEGGS